MRYSYRIAHALVFLLLCCAGKNQAQDILLESQAQVDAFDTTITTINGRLTINSSFNPDPILDLSNLSHIRRISAELLIENNPSLTTLIGLSGIEYVGNTLLVYNNWALLNLNGLENLDTIGGRLEIKSNRELLHVDGLSGLKYIGNDLRMFENESLLNLHGFQSLTFIGRDLYVHDHDELTDVTGLSNVTSPIRDLGMSFNRKLKTLEGLNGITVITRDVGIEQAGYENVNGLDNLHTVGRDLEIMLNTKLTDCHAVDCLVGAGGNVGGAIRIQYNEVGCKNLAEVLATSRCDKAFVFADVNQNCTNDENSTGLPHRRVVIRPGYYVLESDETGRIDLNDIPVGIYTMEPDTTGPWTAPCEVMRSFEITSATDGISIDPIPLTADDPCNMPEISIAMNRARPCRNNQPINIMACNNIQATGLIEDAYVILAIDPLMTVQSASRPYTQLDARRFRFELGDILPGACENFTVYVTVSCDVVVGQTLCMQADLFPLDSCIYNDSVFWLTNMPGGCRMPFDGSDILVEGVCEGDSILFNVTNASDQSMTCHVPVRYYVDTELQWSDSVLLSAHEQRAYRFMADGRTLRMEVAQHPRHPGLSRPNATVERCGDLLHWTPGLVNDRYMDDGEPVIDIMCIEVTGSFDPNDKQGFPSGVTDDHRVIPNQPMEYMVRFQNTGNDTAFKVVVLDTLDTDYNLLTVNPGVSSHPYMFAFRPGGVLEWTFDNILLPDSNTNEPASHGFLTFQVLQYPDLSNGTRLDNEAAIYFDFNEPVLTNTTSHMVDDGIDGVITSVVNAQQVSHVFQAIPNPTTGQVEIIRKEGEYTGRVHIAVFDLMGRSIGVYAFAPGERMRLHLEENSGVYIIRVMPEEGRMETMRVVVQKA